MSLPAVLLLSVRLIAVNGFLIVLLWQAAAKFVNFFIVFLLHLFVCLSAYSFTSLLAAQGLQKSASI